MSWGRALALLVPIIASCELGLSESMPAADEVLLDERDARVVLHLGEANGFPDPAGSYAVVIERAGRAPQTILEGHSQRTSIAHQMEADRLPSGDLVVAWFRTLCRATDVGSQCVDLESEPGGTEMREALRWRIDLSWRSPHEGVPAALALAHHDPRGALPILEALEGSASDPLHDAELHAVIARLRDDRVAIATLERDLPEVRNQELIGLSRACVSALEAPLRAELAHRPDVVRVDVEAALSACP